MIQHFSSFPIRYFSIMSDLKSYIVTLKQTVTDADVSSFKQKITELGGSISSEFLLIKGFAIKLPSIHTDSIKDHDHVATIEEDKEVKIQS